MRASSPALALAVVIGLVDAVIAAPAAAQTPPAPAPNPAAPAAAREPEEPSRDEQRIVGITAAGVSVAALASGVGFGVAAMLEFNCASDVLACNKTLANPITGDEMFDVRAEIEQRALFADMSFLLAGASALVATVGIVNGFVLAPPDEGASAAAASASTLDVVQYSSLVASVSP